MAARPFPTLLAVAALVLPAACGGGSDHSSHSSAGGGAPVAGAGSIEVKARSFAFEPKRIEVSAGQDTTIVLHSTDLAHDFTVDELNIHIHADGGKTVRSGIKPDKPGTYTFYCSVPGHRAGGMEGTLVVK